MSSAFSDWSGLPLGVTVASDAVKGRKLVASRAFAVGEVVICEIPVAIVYHNGGDEGIGATLSEVEHAVWTALPDIAAKSDSDVDLLRMVLKLFLVVNRPIPGSSSNVMVSSKEGRVVCGTASSVLLLESHLLSQDAAWQSSLTAATREMASLLQRTDLDQSVVQQQMLTLASQVLTNAYGVSPLGEPNRSLGFCMLPVVGLLMNHSCAPNVHYAFHPVSSSSGGGDKAMHFRALRPIAQGEEFCTFYVDILDDTPTRRAALKTSKNFTCSCPRCSGWDSVLAKVERGETTDLLADLLADDLDLEGAGTGGGGSKGSGSGKGSKAKSKTQAKAKAKATDVSPALQLADASLCGLSCPHCPLGCGIIISRLGEGKSDFAACLLCGAKVVPAAAEAAITQFRDSWSEARSASTATSSNREQAAVATERLLSLADPLYKQTGGGGGGGVGGGASTAGRRINSRNPALQLHPGHAILLDAYVRLGSLSLGLGQHQRAVQCIDRAIRIMTPTLLPEHHPEAISLLENMADALGMGSSGERDREREKERGDLLARIARLRTLCYGES